MHILRTRTSFRAGLATIYSSNEVRGYFHRISLKCTLYRKVIHELRVVTDGTINRYMVLLKFRSRVTSFFRRKRIFFVRKELTSSIKPTTIRAMEHWNLTYVG